jgi:hypothetical protein
MNSAAAGRRRISTGRSAAASIRTRAAARPPARGATGIATRAATRRSAAGSTTGISSRTEGTRSRISACRATGSDAPTPAPVATRAAAQATTAAALSARRTPLPVAPPPPVAPPVPGTVLLVVIHTHNDQRRMEAFRASSRVHEIPFFGVATSCSGVTHLTWNHVFMCLRPRRN